MYMSTLKNETFFTHPPIGISWFRQAKHMRFRSVNIVRVPKLPVMSVLCFGWVIEQYKCSTPFSVYRTHKHITLTFARSIWYMCCCCRSCTHVPYIYKFKLVSYKKDPQLFSYRFLFASLWCRLHTRAGAKRQMWVRRVYSHTHTHTHIVCFVTIISGTSPSCVHRLYIFMFLTDSDVMCCIVWWIEGAIYVFPRRYGTREKVFLFLWWLSFLYAFGFGMHISCEARVPHDSVD